MELIGLLFILCRRYSKTSEGTSRWIEVCQFFIVQIIKIVTHKSTYIFIPASVYKSCPKIITKTIISASQYDMNLYFLIENNI